jgi:uncharacterized membrane protein YfcA
MRLDGALLLPPDQSLVAMPLTSLALIAATILVSSFLSGVFGMAGGMILLGVLLVYFDVTVAMVVFSIIQFAANGWRAVLWWRHVRWPIFFDYVAGSAVAFVALRAVAYVPDKPTVYFLLGIMPFLVDALPRQAHPNIEWRGVPFVAGALTTVLQFMAGVGGVFLDIFFQKSTLDRKTTVATKAVTQTVSHLLRAGYYGTFGGLGNLDWIGTAGAVVIAVAATSATPYVIERMTDHGFRQWTRVIIYVISVVYLVRAGWLVLR